MLPLQIHDFNSLEWCLSCCIRIGCYASPRQRLGQVGLSRDGSRAANRTGMLESEALLMDLQDDGGV